MTSQADYAELVLSLQKLSEQLDALEQRLRIYDKALRFGESNNPSIALTFKGWMEIVQTPGLPDFASFEHKETVHTIAAIAAQLFQASSNLRND